MAYYLSTTVFAVTLGLFLVSAIRPGVGKTYEYQSDGTFLSPSLSLSFYFPISYSLSISHCPSESISISPSLSLYIYISSTFHFPNPQSLSLSISSLYLSLSLSFTPIGYNSLFFTQTRLHSLSLPFFYYILFCRNCFSCNL